MIRIVSPTKCQVLHRRTSHANMLNVLENINEDMGVTILEDILTLNDFTLEELADKYFSTDFPHKKLTLLVLMSTDYSYYDGRYNRRKTVSDTGEEAYTKVKLAISNYLGSL